jgi:hypothetical protein
MGGVSTFEGHKRSKFETNYESLLILLLFDLESSYLALIILRKLTYFVIMWRKFLPCMNVYLGTIYISTKFRHDRTSNMTASWNTHLWPFLANNTG